MMKKHALASEEPRLAGISILVGQDQGPVDKLKTLTARYLVRPLVLTGQESTATHLGGALEEATATLAPGSILFLFIIGPGFAWQRTVAEALRVLPQGTRVFGVSTGDTLSPQDLTTRAAVAWIAWPGTDARRFADRLLRLWDQGGYLGGHQRFVSDLAATLGGRRPPVLVEAGTPDAAFARQRPFTVSPPPGASLEPLVAVLTRAIRMRKELRVGYRDRRDKVTELRFKPVLLGTSDGEWRAFGYGSSNPLCLHLDRMLSLEEVGQRTTTGGIGQDHHQRCVRVADVWAPGGGKP